MRKWSLVQTLPIIILLHCLFSTTVAGTYIGGQGLPAHCTNCQGMWCVVSNGACFLIACVHLCPFQFWGTFVFVSVLIFGCVRKRPFKQTLIPCMDIMDDEAFPKHFRVFDPKLEWLLKPSPRQHPSLAPQEYSITHPWCIVPAIFFSWAAKVPTALSKAGGGVPC